MAVHGIPREHQIPPQAGAGGAPVNALGLAVLLVLAYLIGATPTSYLAGKLGRGIDLREHGSRNLGATNVYRVLGWSYAIPVGLVDLGKGALPVAVLGPWANGPAWFALAISLPIWAATLWLFGYVSAASLAAAALFPLWVRLTAPGAPYTFWASVALALLIAYSHRANIRRLLNGTDNRFRTRKGVVA